MTDDDLAAAERRFGMAKWAFHGGVPQLIANALMDIPTLIAAVRERDAELDAVCREMGIDNWRVAATVLHSKLGGLEAALGEALRTGRDL